MTYGRITLIKCALCTLRELAPTAYLAKDAPSTTPQGVTGILNLGKINMKGVHEEEGVGTSTLGYVKTVL
jgi:hypothetical protein